VYALVRAPQRNRAGRSLITSSRSLSPGERLEIVGDGAVVAVAARVTRAPRATSATLRRYDRVIRNLSLRFPALLPARFGTCFEDEAELQLVLRVREASFLRSLAHVRQRVQMTIRMSGVPEVSARRGAPRAARGSAAPVTGTSYLRERAAAAAAARSVPGFDPVRAAVARWVRDERVEKRGADGPVTVHHLVPRASAEVYRTAVEREAESAGFRVTVTGPWPPYAFAVDERV
jgi:hypothetical protein